jgi:hypothetical protein
LIELHFQQPHWLGQKKYLLRFCGLALLVLIVSQPFTITTSFAIPPSSSLLDPTLINGKQYTFQLPQGVKGHQFLWTNDFVLGSVVAKEQIYNQQLLRYDIYNQQITLKFVNQFGSEKIIVLSDAWLTNFALGETSFEVIAMDNEGKKIFQTIGQREVRVLYAWKKQMKLNGSSGKSYYLFTEPQRDCYIQKSGEIIPYKWNRSFARAFGKNNYSQIIKYLRKNKISVRKASDKEMEELLNFCNSINQN